MYETLLALLLTMMKRVKKLASDVQFPFTQKDKDKLDSITNPMLIKGTVSDMETLEAITDAQPGWVFFVGADDAEKSEYVRTESGTWEYIGSSNVDLIDYVKKTDFATTNTYGTVSVRTAYGISVNNDGILRTYRPTQEQIESESDIYHPLVPESIPVFMINYGISSKETIPDMQAEISECVKKTDYATATVAGVVKVSTSENTANGISMNSSGQLRIQAATNKEIDDETSNQRPIVPSNVAHMMSNYNIDKETITKMLDRISALEKTAGIESEEDAS